MEDRKSTLAGGAGVVRPSTATQRDWGLGACMGPVQSVVVGRLGESVGRVRERAGARGGLNMTVLDDMYS
jgi:hypothetical protein